MCFESNKLAQITFKFREVSILQLSSLFLSGPWKAETLKFKTDGPRLFWIFFLCPEKMCTLVFFPTIFNEQLKLHRRSQWSNCHQGPRMDKTVSNFTPRFRVPARMQQTQWCEVSRITKFTCNVQQGKEDH